MGQNIDEIFQMSDWKCPSCLEICNCSGRTCDRHNASLGCTRILSGEAREQGYRSVSDLPRAFLLADSGPHIELSIQSLLYCTL